MSPPPQGESPKPPERAPAASEKGKKVDAASFEKNLETRTAALRAAIDQNPDLTADDKQKLWTSVKQTVDKFLQQIGDDLAQLEATNGETHQQLLEKLNSKAVSLLAAMRKAIEQGKGAVLDSEKVLKDVSRANFDRNLARLNRHIDELRRLHSRLTEVTVEGGVMELVFGRMKDFYKQKIAAITEVINQEYANLALLAKLTYPEGMKRLAIARDSIKFHAEFQQTSFWAALGEQMTTKAGLSESWDFYKAYTTGVMKGLLTMVDPRTYMLLAEKIGEGAASLMFCDDNKEKILVMIKGAGDAWNNADANGKAEMLGQFMGSILGTKGLGMATKAGRAAVLSKAQGTVLAADVGAATSGAVRAAARTVAAGGRRAAEGARGAARRVVGAGAGKAMGKVTEVVKGAAEFVATQLKPALEAVSRSITRFRGRLASLTDADMRTLMRDLSAAEKTVAQGRKLAPKGKLMELQYGVKGGEQALKAAQRDLAQFLTSLDAALAAKNIVPAVRTGLIGLKDVAGRLQVATAEGARGAARRVVGAGAGKAMEKVTEVVKGAAEFVATQPSGKSTAHGAPRFGGTPTRHP